MKSDVKHFLISLQRENFWVQGLNFIESYLEISALAPTLQTAQFAYQLSVAVPGSFKDQTQSITYRKANFAPVQNLTFVLGRVFSYIISELFLPSVSSKFMIFSCRFNIGHPEMTCHLSEMTSEMTCHLSEMTLEMTCDLSEMTYHFSEMTCYLRAISWR